jgi:hypothetical protein
MAAPGVSHGGGYDPKASAKALAQNKRAAWIYACAVAGLIGVFVFSHFGKSIFRLHSRRGTLAKILAAPFRYVYYSMGNMDCIVRGVMTD